MSQFNKDKEFQCSAYEKVLHQQYYIVHWKSPGYKNLKCFYRRCVTLMLHVHELNYKTNSKF